MSLICGVRNVMKNDESC